RRLRLAREVGDRDAGQAEDRIDAVELERVDQQVEAVGLLAGRRTGLAGARLVRTGLRRGGCRVLARCGDAFHGDLLNQAGVAITYVIYQTPSIVAPGRSPAARAAAGSLAPAVPGVRQDAG